MHYSSALIKCKRVQHTVPFAVYSVSVYECGKTSKWEAIMNTNKNSIKGHWEITALHLSNVVVFSFFGKSRTNYCETFVAACERRQRCPNCVGCLRSDARLTLAGLAGWLSCPTSCVNGTCWVSYRKWCSEHFGMCLTWRTNHMSVHLWVNTVLQNQRRSRQ